MISLATALRAVRDLTRRGAADYLGYLTNEELDRRFAIRDSQIADTRLELEDARAEFAEWVGVQPVSRSEAP